MKDRLSGIGFSDFAEMAQDSSLSLNEKIGFPDAYREGYGHLIYKDLKSKLTNLQKPQQVVLDIGPGCADLPNLIIAGCKKMKHHLYLIDSREMLAHLPDGKGITKIEGFYPDCIVDSVELFGKFDIIICYSVFHYIFVEAGFWRFLDHSLGLLSPGGQMLIGDIPNTSKRKRFFSSSAGIRFHKEFMKTIDEPNVDHLTIEYDKIDDAVLLGVIMRARAAGCDAYWMPQATQLPMSNRREDLLIIKP